MTKRVCIIGGGISGLTVAFLLRRAGADVVLLEAADRLGGNIGTERRDGFLLENGPNSLLRSPRLIDLIDALGLRSRVLPSSSAAKNRFVLLDGELSPVPMGLSSFIGGDFFSRGAKLKILREPFVRSKAAAGESVAEFFTRRLGNEVVAKAVDPFISGIYAGDVEKLSIEAAFPRFFAFERDHGSLLWGALRNKDERPEKEFPRSFTFINGLSEMIGRLEAELAGSISLGTRVESIAIDNGKFRIASGGSEEPFDHVVISTRADSAGDLIRQFDPDLAERLARLEYPPVAVIRLGFHDEQVGRRPDGFGFLVPRDAELPILGSLWNSSVFPGRAPAGHHLFTSFVGGARRHELFDRPDDELFGMVLDSLGKIMDIAGEPVHQSIVRWPRAIPQYDTAQLETSRHVRRFEQERPGIHFCSNFIGGISVGDCVKNAYAVADRIAASFNE